MATYKSKAILDQLVGDLRLRLPTEAANGLTTGFDASGNPYLIIGTGTTTTLTALIKVVPVTGFGTDILGTAAKVFTPHIIQLCFEQTGTANMNYWTMPKALQLLGECLKFGVQVDVLQTANTVMPTAAVPGTLAGSFSPQIQYGQMASV